MVEHLYEAKTTLVAIPEDEYTDKIVQIAKETAEDKVIYVTLNKTCDALMELFKNKNINIKNIKFIDTITRCIREVEDTKDCTYISSPEAITELAIIIRTHLEYDFDYLIIDAMTNLTTYTDENTTKRFIKNLITKLDVGKTKMVVLAIDMPTYESLIKSVSTFVDRTYHTKHE